MSGQPSESITVVRKKRAGNSSLIAAGVFGVLTCVGMLIALARLTQPEAADVAVIDIIGLAIMVMVGVAGVLGSLAYHFISAHLARYQESLTRVEQQAAVLAEQSCARAQEKPVAPSSHEDSAAMLRLLAELKEVALLPEQERQRRFAQLVEQEYQQRLQTAERHGRARDFHRARQELETLARRFGENERITYARQQLEQAAEATRVQEVALVTTRVKEHIAQYQWDDAQRLSRELAEKYPEAHATKELIAHVLSERKAFALKYRQQMYEALQALAHEKQWSAAAEETRRFLKTFPSDPEADILREQLKTLDANAEIIYRQDVERQIKVNIIEHHYWEALAAARQLISAFPLSPQANVLRPQIPRLEELAKQQKPE